MGNYFFVFDVYRGLTRDLRFRIPLPLCGIIVSGSSARDAFLMFGDADGPLSPQYPVYRNRNVGPWIQLEGVCQHLLFLAASRSTIIGSTIRLMYVVCLSVC